MVKKGLKSLKKIQKNVNVFQELLLELQNKGIIIPPEIYSSFTTTTNELFLFIIELIKHYKQNDTVENGKCEKLLFHAYKDTVDKLRKSFDETLKSHEQNIQNNGDVSHKKLLEISHNQNCKDVIEFADDVSEGCHIVSQETTTTTISQSSNETHKSPVHLHQRKPYKQKIFYNQALKHSSKNSLNKPKNDETTQSANHRTKADEKHVPISNVKTINQDTQTEDSLLYIVSNETDLQVLMYLSKDNNSFNQYAAVKRACVLLITYRKKVKDYIEIGYVLVFVELLHSKNADIQFEAALALAYITGGSDDQTQAVVDANAIPILIKLLNSPNLDIKRLTLRTFGNIIKTNWEFREKCFQLGFLPVFLKLAAEDETISSEAILVICDMFQFTATNPLSHETAHQILPVVEKYFNSNDVDVLNDAFIITYFLCRDQESISLTVKQKFIQKIVDYSGNSNSKIQYDALFVIRLLARINSEVIKPLVDAGVILILIQFIGSSNDSQSKLSFDALSYVVVDKQEYRDKCLVLGIVQNLLEIISDETTSDEQLEKAINLIGDLCENNPHHPIPIEIVTEIIPLLKKHIHHENFDIVKTIIHIFACIVYEDNIQKNQLLIDIDIFKEIIPFLHHSEKLIQLTTINLIRRVPHGGKVFVKHLIENNVLNYMKEILEHEDEATQQNATLFLRRIITRQFLYLHNVISADLMPSIFKMLNHSNVMLQAAAVCVISTSIEAAYTSEMDYLLKQDFFTTYCSFLKSPDLIVVSSVLNGINRFLKKCGNEKLKYCQQIVDCDLLDVIRKQRNDVDSDIRAAATRVITNHFPVSIPRNKIIQKS